MRSFKEKNQQDRKTSDRNRGAVLQSPKSNSSVIGTLKILSTLMTSSAILVGLLLLTQVWRGGSQFLGSWGTWFNAPQPEPKVDIRSMVVQQVRNASELTTAVYAMETVVPASRDRAIGGYVIGRTTLLYIAHGEVRAGVDLSALRPDNIQVTGNAIRLQLPPAKILDSKIDVNRSRVYDYDRGFLGLGPDAAPELQELAQRETLDKIVAAACTSGILQQANERAKFTVSQLLVPAGYGTVTIESQPATTCTSPDSAAINSLPMPSSGDPTTGNALPADPTGISPPVSDPTTTMPNSIAPVGVPSTLPTAPPIE